MNWNLDCSAETLEHSLFVLQRSICVLKNQNKMEKTQTMKPSDLMQFFISSSCITFHFKPQVIYLLTQMKLSHMKVNDLVSLL